MAVTLWSELTGSPTEQMGRDGMSAQRQIICGWDNRGEVLQEFLGDGYRFGGKPRGVKYPGAPGLVVATVKSQNFHNDVLPQEFQSATEGLNRYKSYAVLTIDYEFVKPIHDRDGPEPPEGFFTYRWVPALEVQPIAGRHTRYRSDVSRPVHADTSVMFRIPMIEHILSWHAVKKVPTDAIRKALGGINNAEFLGVPARRLLFDDCNVDTEFVLPFAFDDPRQTFRVDYIFREMQILNAAGTFVASWGYEYRDTPDLGIRGWQEIEWSDGSRLFNERNFGNLLWTEPSDNPLDPRNWPSWLAPIFEGKLLE